MSELNLDSGASSASGGASPGEQNNKEDKAFLSIKAEKKAMAEKLAEANAKLERLEQEQKAKEARALEEQGEYKRLWETEQAAKNELSEKLKKKEAKELALRKIDVVMQELGVPLAKPEYWDFVDLQRIPVDEATGDIDRNIAKQVASDFHQSYPELLAKKSGRLPNESATPSSALTHEQWLKLSLVEKRKRLKDVKK